VCALNYVRQFNCNQFTGNIMPKQDENLLLVSTFDPTSLSVKARAQIKDLKIENAKRA